MFSIGHIAGTFRRIEPRQKTVKRRSRMETQETNIGKRWPNARVSVYVVAPRRTHQRQLVFTACDSELESDLTIAGIILSQY